MLVILLCVGLGMLSVLVVVLLLCMLQQERVLTKQSKFRLDVEAIERQVGISNVRGNMILEKVAEFRAVCMEEFEALKHHYVKEVETENAIEARTNLLTSLSDKHREQEARIEQLQIELARKQEECDEFKADLADSEAQVDNLSQKISDLEDGQVEQQNEIDDYSVQVERIRDELKSLSENSECSDCAAFDCGEKCSCSCHTIHSEMQLAVLKTIAATIDVDVNL